MRVPIHKIMSFFLLCVAMSHPRWTLADTRLPEVIVYGEEGASDMSSAGSVQQVPLKDYQKRVASVPEVLGEQSGLHLTRYGGLEDSTSISIRGSSSDEVLVVLDGIPLNTAMGGGVNLSPYYFESLQSLTIYKGSSPTDSGFVPAAGVVELKSQPVAQSETWGAHLEGGSFQTLKAGGFISKSWERFGFLLSYDMTHTRGDFSFLDDNGTPVNLNDDQVIKRQNNASLSWHPFLKFSYDFDESTRLTGVMHYVRQNKGIPGFTSNQSSVAHLAQSELMMATSFERRDAFISGLNFKVLSYFRWIKNQYDDHLNEIGLGGAQDNDDDSSIWGQKYLLSYQTLKGHLLKFFFSYQHETFRPENFLATPSQGGASARYQMSMGLSDEGSLQKNYY